MSWWQWRRCRPVAGLTQGADKMGAGKVDEFLLVTPYAMEVDGCRFQRGQRLQPGPVLPGIGRNRDAFANILRPDQPPDRVEIGWSPQVLRHIATNRRRCPLLHGIG